MWAAALVVLAAWIYFVRRQRSKSLERTRCDFGNKDIHDNDRLHKIPTISPADAQKIVHEYRYFEETFLYDKALEFALFKTYAIPTISKLLAATKDLIQHAAKRAEDTSVLLTMASFFDLDSEEATLAIARTNWIHGRYGNKISQEDLLYTLSVFMTEPVRWAQHYGWRVMHPIEQEANFVLWRCIGLRMAIDNIPETYAEMASWAEAYEKRAMVFSQTNRNVADSTVALFLVPVPEVMRPFARKLVYALMPDAMIKAFDYPAQSMAIHAFTDGVLKLRALVLANLMLPKAHADDPIVATGDGKYRQTAWRFSPHYVTPSLLNTVKGWFYGYDLTKDKAEMLYSQTGFDVAAEIGPDTFKTKGGEAVKEAAAAMRACPFAR